MALFPVVSQDTCAICNMKFSLDSRRFFCCICLNYIHIKCNSNNFVSTIDKQDNWCSKCVTNLFPFNHFDDDIQFLNCVFDMKYDTNNILHSMDQFKICSEFSLTSNSNIDPDEQFYSVHSSSSTYCNYYLPDQFACHGFPIELFSILHVNARSLNKNLEHVITLIGILKYNFTAVAISETWANDQCDCNMHIPGYTLFGKPRSSRGGGASLYIRESISCIARPDLSIDTDGTCESIFIEIINHSKRKTIIGCLYRAPNNDMKLFNERFDGLLHKIDKEHASCVIAGDYNINLLNNNTHSDTATFVDNISSHLVIPVISRPTRYSNNNSTLIDNILVNLLSDKCMSGIILSDISDHLPIFHIYDDYIIDCVRVSVKPIRTLNDSNINIFNQRLSAENWDSMYTIDDDVDECFNRFHDKFTDLYNTCFPIKHVRKKQKAILKPWITPGILKSINKKHRLYKLSLIKRNDVAVNKYKTYKNKLTKIIKCSQHQYYLDRFENCKYNIQHTWREIKNILYDGRNISSTSEINTYGNLTKNPDKITNTFNEYFANVGLNLAKKIEKLNGNSNMYINQVMDSMFLLPASDIEICNIVKSLSGNKAPGSDEVSASVLKSVIMSIVKPLTHVFNLSLRLGKFPNRLKIAKVVPIFKNDDKLLVCNYRPISVLSVFSKILEKLMFTRMSVFIEKHAILSSCQFGFREHHSTSMALIKLFDKITHELDNKCYSVGIFLDLSKAFDTIDHNILIDKLRCYGFRGIVNDWLASYISDREQYVYINGHSSTTLPIRTGVPQGSILGPLLFILYINDIVNVSRDVDLLLFADDTNVFLYDADINQLSIRANKALLDISNWFKLNRLSVNIKKCNFILFSTKQTKVDIKINIDKFEIERVKHTKFLGVIINEKLTWDDHILLVCNKVSKHVGILRRIKHKIPVTLLRSLYYTLINPYLDYCNIIWAISSSVVLDKLFGLQKRAIRLITNSDWNAHSAPLFLASKVLTIHQLNLLQVASFMYKVYNKLLPQYFIDMFVFNRSVHSHYTRQCNDFHVPHHRLVLTSNSIRVFGVSLWNNICINIRNSNSLQSFRTKYKLFVINM